MSEFYNYSLLIIFSFAVIVFIILFFISAPYGKFLRKGWGPEIKSKWAWMLMEAPSPLLMMIFFMLSGNKFLPQFIFLLLWLSHYIHRTLIYPFTQSGRNKSYPLLLVFFAIVFNSFNGFVNGYGIFHLMVYDLSWLLSWQFITGSVIFISGFIINKTSDEMFRKMKREKPDEYVIPKGWLFNYISCPHYFGEIIEWAGWALLSWSLPGLAFFVFTFANLFPRALSSHSWYRRNFTDYPSERKAVIPFVI